MHGTGDCGYAPCMSHTVIGYARVSTDEQAASGLSIEAQRARIRAYCEARGWTLADVVIDAGFSASTLERPGMAKVRKLMAERLVDGVVSLKLDRLTRSVRDLHQLLKASADTGVALVSVTENLDTSSAAGRLMVTMLGAMAEWEREVIAERTVSALAAKRARGERVSRFPELGTEAGARGEDERAAMDVVESELERDPRASLRTLARLLAERGHVNRSGSPYHPSGVRRMVERVRERNPQLAARPSSATDDADRTRRIIGIIAELELAA